GAPELGAGGPRGRWAETVDARDLQEPGRQYLGLLQLGEGAGGRELADATGDAFADAGPRGELARGEECHRRLREPLDLAGAAAERADAEGLLAFALELDEIGELSEHSRDVAVGRRRHQPSAVARNRSASATTAAGISCPPSKPTKVTSAPASSQRSRTRSAMP